MSATTNQKNQQTDGPHRPSVLAVIEMLKRVPLTEEIRGIAINSKTGTVIVEMWDEQKETLHVFRNIAIKAE